MSIKLEIGKSYILRDTSLGIDSVKIVSSASTNGNPPIYTGILLPSNRHLEWYENGKFYNGLHISINYDSAADLVAEYMGNNPYPLAENPSFAKEIKAVYVGAHICVAVDTGFKKTWCKICEQDMEY